jgi:murein hydrolase activator
MQTSRTYLPFQLTTQEWKYKYGLLPLFLLTPLFVISQNSTKQELEKKRLQLTEEIKFTNKLIEESQKQQSSSLNLYTQLQERYKKRKELYQTIVKESQILSNEIFSLEKEIQTIQERIAALTLQYSKMLRQSYRFHLMGKSWAFILGSHSANQAFTRWRYLNQMKNFQKKQIILIEEQKIQRLSSLTELKKAKESKDLLLREEKKQTQLLESEVATLQKNLADLKKNEKKLKSDLEKYKRTQQKLTETINRIIKEELERVKKEEEEKARKSKETGAKESKDSKTLKKSLPETPQSLQLSQEFSSNKGKLPWPVKKGLVSKPFGNQPHPTLPGLQITNNGVDIHTEPNAAVFSISEGTVVAVKFIPGSKNMVLLKHGQFYSVYSNLDNLQVSTQQSISTGQIIGYSAKNEITETHEIHFELWKNRELLNPLDWLAKN